MEYERRFEERPEVFNKKGGRNVGSSKNKPVVTPHGQVSTPNGLTSDKLKEMANDIKSAVSVLNLAILHAEQHGLKVSLMLLDVGTMEYPDSIKVEAKILQEL